MLLRGGGNRGNPGDSEPLGVSRKGPSPRGWLRGSRAGPPGPRAWSPPPRERARPRERAYASRTLSLSEPPPVWAPGDPARHQWSPGLARRWSTPRGPARCRQKPGDRSSAAALPQPAPDPRCRPVNRHPHPVPTQTRTPASPSLPPRPAGFSSGSGWWVLGILAPHRSAPPRTSLRTGRALASRLPPGPPALCPQVPPPHLDACVPHPHLGKSGGSCPCPAPLPAPPWPVPCWLPHLGSGTSSQQRPKLALDPESPPFGTAGSHHS